MTKVVSLPVEIPVLFEDLGANGRVLLPVTLPISFATNSSAGVTLPATLPISFANNSSTGVTLPVTLPIRFGTGQKVRKKIKIPTKITCEYVNEQCFTKLPLKEVSSLTYAKIPVKEFSWDLKGLILEENIVATMHKPLTLIEEVRSRILVDVEMLDRNNLRIKWYGDAVPKVEVYKKAEIDEQFTDKVAVLDWGVGECEINVDNNSYDIQLLGINGTGESSIINVAEPLYYAVKTDIDIAMNEKVYDVDVDLVATYRIDIDL